MPITSTHNPVVKYVRSLERTSVRQEEGVYLAEGVRLVGEAIDTDQPVELVLYDRATLQRSPAGSRLLALLPDWSTRCYEVDNRVLTAAAQTETPAGVIAVVRRVSPPPLQQQQLARFGLVLDQLADPGNAGTILRTADAAGVGYVVALEGSVDLFSPKVVRAGMGAHFRLPLYPGVRWEAATEALDGATILGLAAAGGLPLYGFTWPTRTVLVVGGEARGLSDQVSMDLAGSIRIPMRQGVESLNAAIAAGIVIYAALGPGLSMST